MLIKCPKCGFSQPSDTYCAKCGVDMENFHPSKKGSVGKFWQNPLFHIGILTLVIVAGVSYIQDQEKNELQNRLSLLKGERSSVASHLGRYKGDVAGTEDSQTASLDSALVPPPPPDALAETTEVPSINPRAAESLPTDSRGDNRRELAAAKLQLKVNVTYAETKNEVIEKLMEGNEQVAPLPEGYFAIINRSAASLGGQLKVLEKISRDINEGRPPQWFLGAQDPETDSAVGLTTSVALEKDENEVLSGEIEVVRALKDPETNQLTKKSFAAPFEINAGQTLMMTGIVPSLNPEGQEWLRQSLMRIFFSNDFQSKQSQFVIFFEFQKE